MENKSVLLPFADNLRLIMRERGLSLGKVAVMAGVSKSSIQGWLNGSCPMDLHAVSALAKCLGVPFKWLLLNEEEGTFNKVDIADYYSEHEVFDGLCRVNIKKLVVKCKT